MYNMKSYTEAIKHIKSVEGTAKERIRVCVISNLGLEPLFTSLLKEEFLDHDINVDISFVEQERIYEIESVSILENADYILNWFDIGNEHWLKGYERNPDITETTLLDYFNTFCLQTLKYIRLISSGTLICLSLTDFSSQSELFLGSLLNQVVLECNLCLLKNQNTLGVQIINIEKLISKCGYAEAYSNKNYRRWNSKYSSKLYKGVANEIYKCFLINQGRTKKCIVLDCDNVLWGGILSEDGIEGICLGNSGFGKEYQDFQHFLLNLYYHGVILTVCSKNDEGDVLRVFREHSGMLLREEHIACFKVNWNDKPHNIKAIADTLNIGQDSIVFIDDSQFEIEAVKSSLPEVSTILYDRDTVYQKLSWFNLKSNVDVANINNRTQTYRTNIERKKLREDAASFDEYILSLDMKFDIHKSLSCELARIVELTQRTNKCTNGKRYTMEQMKNELASSNYNLYTVCLSDKFSDLGVVGVIGICDSIVDLFSLSCRALGRKIEEEMIQYVLRTGVNTMRFKNTSKNSDLKKLFESYGLMVESIS